MQLDHFLCCEIICNKHLKRDLFDYINIYMFRRKYKDIHVYKENFFFSTYVPILALEENHRARTCRLQRHDTTMKLQSKGMTQQ